METIRCPKCGKDVPWRKFCGFCGATLPPRPELKLEESELEVGNKKADKEENEILNALDEVAKPEISPSPQPAIKKPKRPKPAPTNVPKPAPMPKPAEKTVEIAPKQPPAKSSGNRFVVVLVAVVVVIAVLAGGGLFFYKSNIESRIQRRIEEVLSFPSKQVLDQLREELKSQGCTVEEVQVGIKPAKDSDIEAYKSRSGVVHASGTHMIWLKAKCSKVGLLPLASEITAEKPETLPAFYNGKYMVYDPTTNTMVKYIPTR